MQHLVATERGCPGRMVVTAVCLHRVKGNRKPWIYDVVEKEHWREVVVSTEASSVMWHLGKEYLWLAIRNLSRIPLVSLTYLIHKLF